MQNIMCGENSSLRPEQTTAIVKHGGGLTAEQRSQAEGHKLV